MQADTPSPSTPDSKNQSSSFRPGVFGSTRSRTFDSKPHATDTAGYNIADRRKYLICAARMPREEIARLSDLEVVNKAIDQENAIAEAAAASTDYPGTKQPAEMRWEQYKFLRREANLPLRHREHLELIEQGNTKPCNEWTAKLDLIESRLETGLIVALLGGRGTGKTQLAVALIDRASMRNVGSRYIKASDIFREIRATYAPGSKTTESQIFRRFRKPDLLVIDELHQRAETLAENNSLVNILDHRYDDRKDTILIANLDKAQFAESMGASVISRIHECGEAIVCDWKSFRTPGTWETATKRKRGTVAAAKYASMITYAS